MIGLGSFALLSVAVFFGAFVSSLAGFAFSAVAGAVLLHMFQPLEAVPLMMACSVLVQAANLWALRKSLRWRESLTLILGGLLGVPTALWLLHNVDARTFQQVFGPLGSSRRPPDALNAEGLHPQADCRIRTASRRG